MDTTCRSDHPPVADDSPLLLGGRVYRSRLLVGTGRYKSPQILADCLALSGCEIVFVAVRRVRIVGGNPAEFFALELGPVNTN